MLYSIICATGYISFCFTFDSPLAPFYCTNAQLTRTLTDAVVSDIEFHASIIHCKEQVMQAITMHMYSIPTESYNCFEVNWTATIQTEQLLTFKYVSLKTLFLTMRLPTVLTTHLDVVVK